VLDSHLLTPLGLSLGLGLLVGLQRQRSESSLAGIRTFPLITVFGTIAAALAQTYGGAVLAAGFLALAGVIVTANLLRHRDAERTYDPGQTTEAALLLMFGVGAYLFAGDASIAVVVAGGVAVLLQLKEPLHRAVAGLGDHDFKAITQFVLIALVILPLLPDRDFGPYEVLNPRDIWWMVVLIVGLGLCGYLVYKYVGGKTSGLLGGLFGGLVSSTATAAGWSQRAKSAEALVPLAAVAIVLSSSVVFARVLIEVAVVSPQVLLAVAPPIAILMALMLALAFLEHRRAAGEEEDGERPELGNPSELRSAIVFALIYALVLMAVAAVTKWLGPRGLYLVALISGMTDMDAITLSTARMMTGGEVEPATGWRVIVTASLANLAFKLGIVGFTAPRALLTRVATRFSVAFAAGLALIFLWPV
jgi:uncharacterized membrane protein (DUF4010 family)